MTYLNCDQFGCLLGLYLRGSLPVTLLFSFAISGKGTRCGISAYLSMHNFISMQSFYVSATFFILCLFYCLVSVTLVKVKNQNF